MTLKKQIRNYLGVETIVETFFIRSHTNANEPAKQYFTVINHEKTEPALLIRKLILSDDLKGFVDYKVLKKYKNKYLFETRFSIKIKTLNMVMSVINDILNGK